MAALIAIIAAAQLEDEPAARNSKRFPVKAKIARVYGRSFPRVTPHVLRHTFCTNMQQAGIDVKSLQYLMGHSNVSVTLDIYTHINFDTVQEAFGRAVSNL